MADNTNPFDGSPRSGSGAADDSRRPRPAGRPVRGSSRVAGRPAVGPARRSAGDASPRARIERERRKRRNKRIVIGVLIAVGVFLVAGVASAAVFAKVIENNMHQDVITKSVDAKTLGLAQAAPGKPFNVLLMGADYRHGDTAYRADSIIVARVDPAARKVWILSIPRDTKVDIPGYGAQKINAAHSYGGIHGTITAVEKLTGVKINHYVEANFQGFKQVVDAMGGVWINVPVAIHDIQADDSPHHRAAYVPAGWQRLDGEHALTFVRARHQFVDQDFHRMKDQQLFFKALAKQMASSGNFVRLPLEIAQASRYIKTDMSLGDMINTAQALRSAGSDSVYTASVTGTWQTPFVYADTSQMRTLVSRMQAGQPFTPSKTASATASAAGSSTVNPASVTLTVRNGSGTSGLAAQARSVLMGRGFKVLTIGTAGNSAYPQTLIVFKSGNQSAAAAVAAVLPFAKLVPSAGAYTFNTKVLVVVGKDWTAQASGITPASAKSQ